MKIFSNFDTDFKEKVLSNKKQSFAEKDIFVITRSKYYLIFKVLFHFFWYLAILGWGIALLSYIQAIPSIYMIVIFVWFLVVWFRVFHKILKYYYDFTIVTPKGVTTYKQIGILHSRIKELPSQRIKAIEISRTSLLGNIFWYGNVDIIADLSENAHLGRDDEASWVVGLTYVDSPYDIKDRVSKTCFH